MFNGREPDESRADLDLGPLDSISGRLTLMPTPRLTVQISAAHLNEAEAEFPPQPRGDINRVTASATYHRMAGEKIWATTLAYGMNGGPKVIPGEVVDLTTHAGLLESSLSLGDRHTWFGRAELRLRRVRINPSGAPSIGSDMENVTPSSIIDRVTMADQSTWRDGIRTSSRASVRRTC